jgi:hypothetical protein
VSLELIDAPLDIPWKRLAFSRDMIETNRQDGSLVPKWRSSMAVYAHVLPEETTREVYPDRRILYLKLTASITGWCPAEDLRGGVVVSESNDPWQRSGWQVVDGATWASEYWKCLGAIAQVAIYPRDEDGVALDDYPYIVDFEPKKRELYESVSQSGEVLSGSSGRTSTTKGFTSTVTTEQSVRANASIPFQGGVSVSLSKTESDQSIDNKVTDTSTERRETQSHSTQFSQLYQLFNGYHLGTNRAVFAIFPRPHTASQAPPVDQNIVNGERALEGIQEMFLVISMPRAMPGVCVRAWLDTGHRVAPHTQAIARYVDGTQRQGRSPNGGPGDEDEDEGYPPRPDAPKKPERPDDTKLRMVVTRRDVAGCATFDGDALVPVPVSTLPPRETLVSAIVKTPLPATMGHARGRAAQSGPDARLQLVNDLNDIQVAVRSGMLSAFASARYTVAPFVRTNLFWGLVTRSVVDANLELDVLAKHGYLDDHARKVLLKARIASSAELLAAVRDRTLTGEALQVATQVREKLLKALWQCVQKPAGGGHV